MPFKQYKVKTGEPVKASDFNDLLDEVHRLAKLTVHPPLFLSQTANGMQISIETTNGRLVEGFLTENITASTSQGEAETTADMTVYNGTGQNWANSNETITLTNRDDTLSADTGSFVIAQFLNGEWRALWVGC